ncbi:hypothetical protein HY491_04245 [Candidatus Woesearchaeota archaeon]|nr:hypothetical protein [Candidatus Woesearchaeota archaeon]
MKKYKCLRCEHAWKAKEPNRTCPKCNTLYWFQKGHFSYGEIEARL